MYDAVTVRVTVVIAERSGETDSLGDTDGDSMQDADFVPERLAFAGPGLHARGATSGVKPGQRGSEEGKREAMSE